MRQKVYCKGRIRRTSKMPEEHTHKYEKIILGGRKVVRDQHGFKKIIKTGGYEVMKCTVPECTHYIALELAIGRKSICWVCEEEMILTKENVRNNKPIHRDCRRQRIA